jgi:Fe-S cluster assembly protein SufD
MTRTSDSRYATDFRAEQKKLDGTDTDWLETLRAEALARFESRGLPGPKEEEWRETSVAAIANGAFALATPPTEPWTAARRDALPLAGIAARRFLFVDGALQAELSDDAPDGVEIGGLASAIAAGDETVRAHLGRISETESRSFSALNTAFLADGAYVRVRDGAEVEDTLHVVHVLAADGAAAMSHPRTLTVVGDRARVRIVESYVAAEDVSGYLRNAVTEMVVGQAARVDHVRIQRDHHDSWHLCEFGVRQGRDSHVATTHFALGARFSRVDAGARLEGEGGHHALNGLYVCDDEDHVDHHTTLDHAVPHCTSHELFKGILGGRSKAVFKGRIIVRQDAQKTDAIQHNPNLLLSDDATIHTRPQLEIYADDVRCTHGATVGQIDAEQTFYLRTRGIGPEEARDLLIHAFARDVLDHVEIDGLREVLEREIDARLPDA